MPRQDSVSWAAMIAGYTQSGLSEDILRRVVEIGRKRERVSRSSFTCVWSTCADITVLEYGRQLNGRLVKVEYGMGCFVGNALIAVYCKCGSIEEAVCSFQDMEEKDIVSWNTMVAGYARHGLDKESLQIFDMMRMTSIKPDDVTMIMAGGIIISNGVEKEHED